MGHYKKNAHLLIEQKRKSDQWFGKMLTKVSSSKREYRKTLYHYAESLY